MLGVITTKSEVSEDPKGESHRRDVCRPKEGKTILEQGSELSPPLVSPPSYLPASLILGSGRTANVMGRRQQDWEWEPTPPLLPSRTSWGPFQGGAGIAFTKGLSCGLTHGVEPAVS